MYRRLSILCCLLLLFSADVLAQWEILQKVDSFLIKMQHTKADTNYVVRPDSKLTIRLLNNFSGSDLLATQHFRGYPRMSIDMRTNMRWTVTSSLNYRGVSVALSVNPSHVFDWNKDFELNVNSYGNRFGADFVLHRTSETKTELMNIGVDLVTLNPKMQRSTLNANAYYVFNYLKFSYPAAFTQSFIQKRSAGSIIVGMSYQSIFMEVEDRPMIDLPNPLKAKLIGVGAGYGYNYVIKQKWLVHLSALPTIVMWHNLNMQRAEYTERGSHPLSLPNMLTTGRFSVIHYFNSRRFVGLTAVVNHTHLGQSGSRMVDFIKWRARLLYGIRF